MTTARRPPLPDALIRAPFRGRDAVARGLLTRSQLKRKTWRRLFRDVYASVELPCDALLYCQGAALLLPAGGALSHRSATFLYGAMTPVPAEIVEITAPIPRRQGQLLVHRCVLTGTEIHHRGGLPVTSPARTAFDVAAQSDLVEAVVNLEALLAHRVVRITELPTRFNNYANRPGAGRARAALALARPLVESPMESRLRLCLVLGGLPEPTVQHRVYTRSGQFVARLDLAYPDLRLGIEYDGDHHRSRETFRRDVCRLNELRLSGWTVLRFTSDDVLRHPDRTVAQVRRALTLP